MRKQESFSFVKDFEPGPGEGLGGNGVPVLALDHQGGEAKIYVFSAEVPCDMVRVFPAASPQPLPHPITSITCLEFQSIPYLVLPKRFLATGLQPVHFRKRSILQNRTNISGAWNCYQLRMQN
jgi:hypothetical protein